MAKEGVETVTIRRNLPGGPVDDFYGEEDDNLADVAVLKRCIIWPRAATRDSERGIHTIAGLHIFVPSGQVEWDAAVAEADRELRPEDHVVARGKDWQMEGDVGDWRKKAGDPVGYLFEVGRWSS